MNKYFYISKSIEKIEVRHFMTPHLPLYVVCMIFYATCIL